MVISGFLTQLFETLAGVAGPFGSILTSLFEPIVSLLKGLGL